ncbi:hypothetical protein BG000_007785 [Podila horticola]|nr:hypothetical protein BG000_007785 [Podila horticola]
MWIHAEAAYVTHRFVATCIAPEAMNMFPFVHPMEVFEHAKTKTEQIVDQFRQIKAHAIGPKCRRRGSSPHFKKLKRAQCTINTTLQVRYIKQGTVTNPTKFSFGTNNEYSSSFEIKCKKGGDFTG